MTRDQIEKYQIKKINDLIDYARLNCEFYKHRFPNQKITKLADLEQIPVQKRADLQNNLKAMISIKFLKNLRNYLAFCKVTVKFFEKFFIFGNFFKFARVNIKRLKIPILTRRFEIRLPIFCQRRMPVDSGIRKTEGQECRA